LYHVAPVDSPHSRFTLTEAFLLYLAAVAGLFTAGGILYSALDVWALPLVQLLFVGVPVVIAARGRGSFGQLPRLVALQRIPLTTAIGALLVGVSFWYLEVRLLVPIAERWLSGQETSEAIEEALFPPDIPIGVLILLVSVFPALCEELLFRGALLRAFRPRLGAVGAVLLSAALFAIMHVYPAQMLPTFVFGLVLGALALRSGSVVTSMLVHLVHNATIAAVSLDAWPAAGEQLDSHPDAALAVAAAVTAAGLALVLVPGSRWFGSRPHGSRPPS
jgi:membrane protease YdiL (CAAX protease family)